MRKIWTAFTIFVLLFAGVVIVPSFINWDKYKPEAKTKIKAATGLDTEFNGPLSLSILPTPHLSIKDIKISAPGDKPEAPLAHAKSIEVYVELMPLFSKNIEVSSITLDTPIVNVTQDTNGRANWMTDEITTLLSKGHNETEGLENNASENKASKSINAQIGNVKIENGQVAITDQKNKKTIRIENIYVELESESMSGPFEAEGELDYNGQEIDFNGQFLLPKDTPKTVTADVEFDVDGADGKFKGMVKTAAPFDVDGDLNLDVESLENTLDGFVKNVNVPAQFNKFDAQGKITGNLNGFRYDNFTLQIAEEKITGDVVVNLDKKSKTIEISPDLKSLPGGGDLKANISLQNAGIGFDLDGTAKNLAQLMRFAGVKNEKPLPFQSAKFDITGKNVGNGFILQDSQVTLDNMPINIAGSYIKKPQTRDLLNIKVSTNTLDLVNGKLAQNNTAQSPSSPQKAIKDAGAKLSLPFDLGFDVAVETLKTKAMTLSGFSAKGRLDENTLKLTNAKVNSVGGALVLAKGIVKNIKELDDLDFNVEFQTKDLPSTLKTLGMKSAPNIPPAFKSIDTKSDISGSLNELEIETTLNSSGGKFEIETELENPLSGKPKIETIEIHAQHASTMKLLRMLAPTAPYYASFEKAADIKTTIAMGDKAISIKDIKGTFAGTSLNGGLNINTAGSKPAVNGSLNFGELIVKSGSSGGKSSGGSTTSSGGGKWSSTPLNSDWLNAANLDLDITANALTYETWNLNKPNLDFVMQGGKLSINGLNAGVHGGQISLNGTVAQAQGGGLALNLNPSIKGIQMEGLVKSAVGSRAISGSGVINFDGNFSGTGQSQRALVSSLSGQGAATGSAIVINGLDISKFVNAFSGDIKVGTTALGLLESTSQGGSTSFDKLDGAFTMNNGVATLSKLDLTGPTANMTGSGTVDLLKWWINTKHKITVNKANAAEGEEMPSFSISLNGPLNNPARGIAEGAINNYLQKKLGKKINKALGGDIGQKLNEKLGNELGGEVGNVLNNFLGTPKQQAPANNNTAPSQQNQEQAPTPQQQTPEDVINDAAQQLLKGLF